MTRLFITIGISIYGNMVKWHKLKATQEAEELEEVWSRIKKGEPVIKGDWKKLDKAAREFIRMPEVKGRRNCAEIQSINKIMGSKEWKQETFTLHLICTRTDQSIHAGMLILEYYERNSRIHCNSEVKEIDGLQIKTGKKFHSVGLQELVEYITELRKKPDVKRGRSTRSPGIINITSGFKPVLPIYTILAQLYDYDLVYIYEGYNELLIIPPLPFSFDISLMEALYHFFLQLKDDEEDNRIIDVNDLEQQTEFPFFKNNLIPLGLMSATDKEGIYEITYLGKMVEQHILEQSPNTTTSFGRTIELMCYEYFNREPMIVNGHKCLWVRHSEKIGFNEFDLLFYKNRDSENCLAIAEVKSLRGILQFTSKNGSDFRKQLKNQIKSLIASNGPKKYVLFVYGIQTPIFPIEFSKNIDEIKRRLETAGFELEVLTAKFLIPKEKMKITRSFFENIYKKKFTGDAKLYNADYLYENPYCLVEPFSIA